MFEVEKLSKRYAGLQALSDVCFNVEKGEILALIGPNGAGKSTLFNCVAGSQRPTNGKVYFKGREVTGYRPDRLAAMGMARTFQLMKPFKSMTVLENVVVPSLVTGCGVAEAASRAMTVLERVGLADSGFRLAQELSTAGRKRLELARGLALQPELLLLDEVMSGLVPAERGPLLDLVGDLAADGMTIIFVEHLMQAVTSLAKRAVVLHHGEVLASGDTAAVLSDPNVVEAYLGGSH